MQNIKTYDVLVIGGGISACVFVSNYLKNNLKVNIALIEAGRGLGGRSSSRLSQRFEGWEINHGSPNLNIFNSSNNKLLQTYIDELLKNNLIKVDDSEFIELNYKYKSSSIGNSDFICRNNYCSDSSMSELSQNIIALNNLRDQIDYYFETLIIKVEFTENEWKLTSNNGDLFKSKSIICSSNLLLHKRSMEIMKINHIPLRKAFPKGKDAKIDLLLSF